MTASPLHLAPHRVARNALALAAVLSLSLLGTGACSKKVGDPQTGATVSTVLTASPETSGGPSGAPSAAASGSPSGSAKPRSSPTGGGQPVSYPSTAKAYGLATLAAWASGSSSRLDLFATQPAVAQFMGHGKPNSQWDVLSCAAAQDGHTACNYRNAHGDDAQLSMQNSQLGHPTATTDVFINKTTYSATAADYVSAFMAAWGDNNRQRMTRYSSSSIAAAFFGKTPPTGSQTNAAQSGSTWTVMVTGLPLGSGNWTFTVNASKLGGGNAITSAKSG